MAKVSIPKGDIKSYILEFSALKIADLEVFVQELNALITRKKTKSSQYRIKELYELINQTILSEEQQLIFELLHEKLLEKVISTKEHQLYLNIAAEEANLRNQRVQYMIELSQLREIPLSELMIEIGLKPLQNV